MIIIATDLPGVLIVEPRVFGDNRGYFMESWNRQRYKDAGFPQLSEQDNVSFSTKGILRGLHFQNPQPQGKLVAVLQGEVFDVAVDIRQGSPTFGRWVGVYLSDENRRQLFVPPDFAHGFCVTSEKALFTYKCTDFYNPQTEFTLRWDDPDIGVRWPLEDVSLSDKDRNGRPLREFSANELPRYSPDSIRILPDAA